MSDDTAIAVIGAGCRFPDAWNPQQFWRNIAEGRVAIRDLDPGRLRAAGLTDEVLESPDYVKRAAGVPGADEFAAEFFGYSPTEADATDPQQRIFLEVCWEALESAGRPPKGSPRVTGVFAGCSPSTYMTALHAGRALEGGVTAAVDDVALHLGGLGDFLSSRVAYKLGLRGPSIGVQTACSSALTAVHYAVLSLLSGECDLALAGGASVNEPLLGYRYQPGGLSSRDGYCRPFDARSTGTSFSSGVGAVALRRLGDALADGDPVLAVIHGTAVGNDGSARSGFTAPSPAGLADVIAATLDVAGIRGSRLRYVEAHGSGTPLGDQIELRGLTEGVGAGKDPAESRTGYCGLGSVKANVGHCGPAAGIAGLIKAVQVARTGELPPHPLYERPRSPGVLAESPFTISAEPGRVTDGECFVLVNSMGLGGTNATAVLGPPPAPVRGRAPERERVSLVLSARTTGELDTLARDMADALEGGAVPAADAAHTLRVGRVSFAERRVVTAAPELLPQALRQEAPGTPRPVRRVRVVVPGGEDVHGPLVERLTRALRGRCEVVTDTADRPGPEGCFTVVIGDAEPAPGQHVLDPDGSAEALADRTAEAVTVAWLHGADVDWEALAGDRGRRVALPTYPFTRTRHWALDRLPPLAVPPAAVAKPAAADDRSAEAAAPASDDPVEADLLGLWRELFGVDTLGLDDEFGALGGESLTAMRIEAAVQRRHGVSVNVFRAGGSQATVRRLARVVTGLKPDGGEAATGTGTAVEAQDGEADLLNADLALDLGQPSTAPRADAPDTLLTTATDLLGTFVLHELLRTSQGRVHCVVPADGEREGRELLRTRAAAAGLPEPDPERVRLLLGGPAALGELLERHDGARIGRVVHRAEPVGRTGSYAQLRTEALLPLADLLTWMRKRGVQDFSCVSSLAACGTALGGEGAIRENRDQPLEPVMDGPATVAWVAERLLERAEEDGMRVRVFRTGLLLGATGNGACDPTDPLWQLLAGSLAVGMHPRDDRPMAVTPVDLAARAVAELSFAPGSVGRAYHLAGETPVTPASLCELLAGGGRATRTVPDRQWQRAVALHALDRENEALDPLAPRRLSRFALGGGRLEAHAWSAWLARGGHDPAPSRELLWRCLDFAAAHHQAFAELLAEHTRTQGLR
ncbi:polyketide synthase type I [Streptomyces piniterrae]|uniref:Polyketide synthase type I n=1 Tax=Streptomyces piniterrae TaxID=2571125 RepID=A0A4U0NWJ9_9ACTN|nr:beta-ketoacyl synthase N-terminal-like domain-containing protein [Streptomyces piniterrae]TJZ59109.1 polyketide synthase type I [Streptomyces piniterrae]